jgi:hypothetical protein
MTRLTLFRLTLGLLLGFCACGGDDKPSGGGTAGSGGAGGKGSAAGSGGSSTGTGSGKEGDDCDSDKDCGKGLNCIGAESIQVSATQEALISVCARKCSGDNTCMDDETCFSFNGKPDNALCWNLTSEAGMPCGPADTSVCDEDKNLECLVTASSTTGSIAGGQCVQLCDPTNPVCPSGLTCLAGSGSTQGVCGTQLKRGDDCISDPLSDCAPADVCITDGQTGFCLQDCTKSMMCDESNQKCMALPGDDGSFCM